MKLLQITKLAIVFLLLITFFIGCEKDEDNDVADPFISGLISDVNSDSIQSYVEWLQGMGTRFMLANNKKQVAELIQNKFISLGFTEVKIDSFLNSRMFNEVTYQTWQYNVVATIYGIGDPSNYCIIGAHYDTYTKDSDLFSYSPGANDNASGVAAVLEIARILQKQSFHPLKTIQFVTFAAEELGLYGSWDFADKSARSQKNISMMINFDMIAHWPDNDPTKWTVNIINYDNSTTLKSKAKKACSLYTELASINDNTDFNRSDSYLFFRYGYPAIYYTSSFDDNTYHTSDDKVENCNFDYCSEVVKASCALVVQENI